MLDSRPYSRGFWGMSQNLMILRVCRYDKASDATAAEEFTRLFSLPFLQLNNFCIQSPKCINEGMICSSLVDLHMKSKISKNRRWRIEPYADVSDDVQPECGESEEHLVPLKSMYPVSSPEVVSTIQICKEWKRADYFGFHLGEFAAFAQGQASGTSLKPLSVVELNARAFEVLCSTVWAGVS